MQATMRTEHSASVAERGKERANCRLPHNTSGFELHTFLAITQGPSQVAMRVMGAIAAAQLALLPVAGAPWPALIWRRLVMPDQKCSMRRQHSAPLTLKGLECVLQALQWRMTVYLVDLLLAVSPQPPSLRASAPKLRPATSQRRALTT